MWYEGWRKLEKLHEEMGEKQFKYHLLNGYLILLGGIVVIWLVWFVLK